MTRDAKRLVAMLLVAVLALLAAGCGGGTSSQSSGQTQATSQSSNSCALKGSKIANATSIAALKGAKLGAPVGTTSYDYIVNNVKPSQKPNVYDTLNDSIAALKARQIDGVVVDLPTAFYMTAVQVPNGK